MSENLYKIRERIATTEDARTFGIHLAEFGRVLLGGFVLILLIVASERLDLPAGLGNLFQILRLLLGLAYVLFIPGYCIMAMVVPYHNELDSIERTGLSVGLSIVVVPVIALILDSLPWGLRLWPIVLGQMISVILFSAIAVVRRARLSAEEAYVPHRWRLAPWWRGLVTSDKRIYLVSAGTLLMAVLVTAWVFLVPSADEFMTEFYILGPDDLAENYPREVSSGEQLTVQFGIANSERAPISYFVELWAFDPWNDRRRRVGEAGPIHLDVGQTHEQAMSWSMPWSGDDQQLLFYLYADESLDNGEDPLIPDAQSKLPAPIRQLRLWLNVSDSG